MKLLIVDDHAGVRALIRDIVGTMATQVRECASGEEALTLCQAYSPDCVTMDLRMSAMHGLAAVQQIRQLHPAANIVVVTQFDHDIMRERAQRAGADGFVTKDNLTMLRSYIESLTTRPS
jgi:two-component system invasion response regulator UvrY